MLWKCIKTCMLRNPFQTIRDANQTLTFVQVVEESEKLAKQLSRNLYGIHCKSDVKTIIAILACMCARKTALPLSNRYGEKYNSYIVETMEVHSFIEDDGESFVVRNGAYRKEEKELQDVAWVLCTSGSKGKPKGVMLTYDAIYRNLLGSNSFFETGSKDRVLAGRGFYHCSSLTGELLMSLVRGAGIYCYSGGFLPAAILRTIEKENISVYSGTPTVFYYLCQMMEREKNSKSKLRYCNVGGERMSKQSFERIRNNLTDTAVIHSYGLTETCSRATYAQLNSIHQADCVGDLLPGMEAVIVDERGNACGPDEKGEVLFKGKCLMKGYYLDSIRTEKVMDSGWFKTGDVGYLDSDKKLHIVGRKDDMIIRAGVNIYPHEIEQVLREEPVIADVKVSVDTEEKVTQELVMQVVAAEAENLSKAAVLALCKRLLPEYLIPSKIQIVKSLSLSQAGKR